MERKRLYNTAEALQIILAPNSDSEMSDFELSDEEIDISQVDLRPRVGDDSDPDDLLQENENVEDLVDAEEDHEDAGGANFDANDSPVESEEIEGQNVDKIDISAYEKYVPRWRNKAPPVFNSEYLGEEFTLPPVDCNSWTPLNYFELFWKADLNVLLSEQTNLYSVQRKGTSLKTTAGEIQQFIGLQMFMSILELPSYRMYWAKETRYPPIADVMSVNRYKLMREYLHVSDNLERHSPENIGNKLYKIQPVLDHVRENCLSIQPEVLQSIDEQIIPAKTKYSGIRQYNPKKPVKWGFKNFVRAGSSGIMYDFFLYQGKEKTQKVTGPYAVLRLLETLPKNEHFKVFFDSDINDRTSEIFFIFKGKILLPTGIKFSHFGICFWHRDFHHFRKWWLH